MIKNTRKIGFLFSLFVTLSLSGKGADSLLLIKKEFLRQTLRNTFTEKVYSSPSQMFYSPIIPYSKISFGFKNREEKISTKEQLGKGYNRASVQLNNFVNLNDNSKVWGEAYYKNSVFRSIVWNQTSDYEMLYPYVMGDSIQGKLKSEAYFFKGGYTKKTGRFSYSSMLTYRGLLEYRDVDPRPKNNVSNLTATLGGAVLLNDKINLGLDLACGKYRQKNNVKFFSELGASPEYHFVGLGRDYARFFGDKLETYYDGNFLNFTLSMQPKNQNGFLTSLAYNRFSFNKIIANLNNLPLANLLSQHFSGDIIYKQQSGRNAWGGLLNVSFTSKMGTENIFGDAINREYPKIAEAKQFYFRENLISSKLFFDRQFSKRMYFSLAPSFGLGNEKELYVYPYRSISRSLFQSSLDASFSVFSEQNVWRVKGRFKSNKLLKSGMYLTEMDDNERFRSMLENNFRFYASSDISMELVLAWTRKVNNQLLVQLEGVATYNSYKKAANSISKFQINLNLIF